MADTILRLPAVKQRTGLSRTTIYLRVSAGTFPSPVSLGARAIGWLESEVDSWLASQVNRSRAKAVEVGVTRRRGGDSLVRVLHASLVRVSHNARLAAKQLEGNR
jgi:prophage regulatory protein